MLGLSKHRYNFMVTALITAPREIPRLRSV
jgi:hypothetical protein